MTAWALLLVGLHGQPVLIHQPSQQVCQEQIAMVRALPPRRCGRPHPGATGALLRDGRD